MKHFVGLWCVVRDGNYLVAATDDPMGDQDEFWPDAEDGDEIVWAYVPKKDARAFVLHGTSDQVFSDGYEAFDALIPHISTEED